VKTGFFSFLLVVSGFLLATCSDNSSNPTGNQPAGTVAQIPGCVSHGMNKISATDTNFVWTFTDRLVLDFGLLADCSIDSIRFATSHSISNDTIYVVSVDTATQNEYCICDYIIHAEFENLPLDHYVIICTQIDNGTRIVVYAKDVYRSAGQ